jgi:alpha-glucoside transport system substrate-binding protein
MNTHRVGIGLVIAAVSAALIAAATAGGAHRATRASASISVLATWSGAEQKSFQAVLDAFTAQNPDVQVSYKSGGDQLAALLSTAIQGGNPPDIALIPQPGLMKSLASQGALKPISFVAPLLKANYAPVWATLGQVNGVQYGLVFKGANKSTVWYNVPSFRSAGVKAPKTWAGLLKIAKTLTASGVRAYSIAGADGWTLTDLFENIYLRQAGPAKYDQLSSHKIKWTDPSVKSALRTMALVLGDKAAIPGGTRGALQTDFSTSVSQVFTSPPKAAMVFEGDFVVGVITSSTKAKPGTGFNQFPFPAIATSNYPVVGGGDIAIMLKDNPAAEALIKFLASPQAGEIWAKLGGFSSPNKNVPASAYPDPITRATATALARAKVFRFDMSDLQPSSFGGTVGQGEFKDFQDFLRNTKNVNGVAAELERDAAKAYK